ncbi:MAG: histone H1 [Bacteroidota bacterium]
MNRYEELLKMIQSFEKDFKKFYTNGNKTAGVRVRKDMQQLRRLAKSIRDEIQLLKDDTVGAGVGDTE